MTAAAARTPNPTRRAVTSDRHALPAQPSLELTANLAEPLLRAGLEAQHEDGLGVGGADESPSVTEEDTHSIHVTHVVRTAEVVHGLRHDVELAIVAAVHADLRRAHELRHVGEELTYRAARVGDDAQEARGPVECVVMPVESL